MEALPRLKWFLSSLESYIRNSTSEQDCAEKLQFSDFQESCTKSKSSNRATIRCFLDLDDSFDEDPILPKETEIEETTVKHSNRVVKTYFFEETVEHKNHRNYENENLRNKSSLRIQMSPGETNIVTSGCYNHYPLKTKMSRKKYKIENFMYKNNDRKTGLSNHYPNIINLLLYHDIHYCFRNINNNICFTQPLIKELAHTQNLNDVTRISCFINLNRYLDAAYRMRKQETTTFGIFKDDNTIVNSNTEIFGAVKAQTIKSELSAKRKTAPNTALKIIDANFNTFENTEEIKNLPELNRGDDAETDTVRIRELDVNEDSMRNKIKEISTNRRDDAETDTVRIRELDVNEDSIRNKIKGISTNRGDDAETDTVRIRELDVNEDGVRNEIKEISTLRSIRCEIDQDAIPWTNSNDQVRNYPETILLTDFVQQYETSENQMKYFLQNAGNAQSEFKKKHSQNLTHKRTVQIRENTIDINHSVLLNCDKATKFDLEHEQRVNELTSLINNLKLVGILAKRESTDTSNILNVESQTTKEQENLTTSSSLQSPDSYSSHAVDIHTEDIPEILRSDLETQTSDTNKSTILIESVQIDKTKEFIYNLPRSHKDIDLVRSRRLRSEKTSYCTVPYLDYEEQVERPLPPPERLDWKSYHRLKVIYDFLYELESTYPSLCSVRVIGHSHEGRDIKMLKISNSQEENLPVWIDAGIHAREWIAPAVNTYIINYIARNFRNLPKYLTDIDWYFLPVANPDGYEYSHTDDRFWRKNKACINKQCYGVDLNRNFSYGWGCPGSSANPSHCFYRGSKPFSEPESRAIKDVILHSGVKFKVYLSLHCYGQKIIFPYACKEQLCPSYVRLLQGAAVISKAIYKTNGNIYKAGTSKDLMYRASGTSQDWCYGVARVPYCYLIELCDKNHRFKMPPENIEAIGNEILNCVKALIEFVKQQRADQNSEHRVGQNNEQRGGQNIEIVISNEILKQ